MNEETNKAKERIMLSERVKALSYEEGQWALEDLPIEMTAQRLLKYVKDTEMMKEEWRAFAKKWGL